MWSCPASSDTPQTVVSGGSTHRGIMYYYIYMFMFGSWFFITEGRRHGLPEGVPNQRVFIDDRVKRIDQSLLWTPAEAVQRYRRNGGRITDPAEFGNDPLLGDASKLEIRRQAFADRVPSFEPIFSSVVNGDDRLFREGLIFLCDITYRLSCSWLFFYNHDNHSNCSL